MRELEQQQRAQEKTAEQQLAEARARLAERERLVELCRGFVVPALEQKLLAEAERCKTALQQQQQSRLFEEEETQGTASEAPEAAREEAALLELTKARITEALRKVDSVAEEMEQVQRRVERVLSFVSDSASAQQTATTASGWR